MNNLIDINRIKIAICFSGQIRTGVLTSNNIKNFIGDLLPLSDVFVHTWDVISTTSSDLSIAGVTFKESNDLFKEFEKVWSPKKIIVENYDEWHKKMPVEPPLFYSLYESNRLRKEYELENNIQYDFVIKLRPDVIYNPSYKLENELSAILNSENCEKTIYTLDREKKIHFNIFDDVLWIAFPKVFDAAVNYYFKRQAYYFERIKTGEYPTLSWQNDMANYLTNNKILYKSLNTIKEGTPFRWELIKKYNLTVEKYESEWNKFYYNFVNY